MYIYHKAQGTSKFRKRIKENKKMKNELLINLKMCALWKQDHNFCSCKNLPPSPHPEDFHSNNCAKVKPCQVTNTTNTPYWTIWNIKNTHSHSHTTTNTYYSVWSGQVWPFYTSGTELLVCRGDCLLCTQPDMNRRCPWWSRQGWWCSWAGRNPGWWRGRWSATGCGCHLVQRWSAPAGHPWPM